MKPASVLSCFTHRMSKDSITGDSESILDFIVKFELCRVVNLRRVERSQGDRRLIG